MANKLTPENIEAAVQHLENIQSGVTPILDGANRTIEDAEIIEPLDLGTVSYTHLTLPTSDLV